MLKITKLFEKLATKMFRTGNDNIVRSGGNKIDKIIRNMSKSKKLKNNKSKI